MVLTNKKDKKVKTTVYIVEGEDESLLGKEDAIKLGIIRIDRDGVAEDKMMEDDMKLRCITPEVLKDQIKDGIVSGGQTQDQIDAAMKEIADRHAGVFQGMVAPRRSRSTLRSVTRQYPSLMADAQYRTSSRKPHKRSCGTCWTMT